MQLSFQEISDQRQQPAADLSCPGATAHEGFPSSRHLTWLITALLVYFGGRLLFFAVSISPFVPPDEVTHFGKCKIFAKVFLLPENSFESYQYGLVTNIPWLYFWIMGKLLHLNFFGIADLTFLRLLNIPLAFGTVYFVWRMLRLLTDDRLTQVLLIVAMTNTLMFSFVSASVSYDNLANLLAAMSVFYLLAFFKNRSGDLLAASLLCQLAGCLTKNTFLPLVLILNILLVVHEFRSLRVLPSVLKAWLHGSGKRAILLILAILLSLTFNIQLYGGNYLHYRTLNPETFDVLPLEHALQYRLAARAYILNLFKEGRISVEQAKEMAVAYVSHPGDRSDTIGLVEGYAYLENHRDQMLGPVAYVAIWLLQMMGSTFGIKAHLGMMNYGITFLPMAVLILLAGIAFPVRWRPGDMGRQPLYLAVIAAFYGVFLMYFINYSVYLENRDPGLTVAGRYIFPVIGPLYVLASYYLLRLFRNDRVRLGISLAAALIFIASDFPFFLARVTPEWYVWRLPN